MSDYGWVPLRTTEQLEARLAQIEAKLDTLEGAGPMSDAEAESGADDGRGPLYKELAAIEDELEVRRDEQEHPEPHDEALALNPPWWEDR